MLAVRRTLRRASSYGQAVQAAGQSGGVRVERHQNDIAHTEAQKRRAADGGSGESIFALNVRRVRRATRRV